MAKSDPESRRIKNLKSKAESNPTSPPATNEGPQWQNILPVLDARIETRIDHKTRTIWLVPIVGRIFVTPKPIKIKGELYTYVLAEPDTRIPDKFRVFYDNRHIEHSLDTLVRCFLPVLYLSYKSMNTFLPVRGVYDRSGENSLVECHPYLKAEAEFAVSIGKLPAKPKKKPYCVTPTDFVAWLVESKYWFIGDAWVKELLKCFRKAVDERHFAICERKKRGHPSLTDVKEQQYRDIAKKWKVYSADKSRPTYNGFRQTYQLPNGVSPSFKNVQNALNWVHKKKSKP